MNLSFVADFFDNAFHGFDSAILSFMHTLADACGFIFTPFARFVTLIGEKGFIILLMAVIFALFAKTRKAGVCMFGAVCFSLIITSILLKDSVARLRPFEAAEQFKEWWRFVGSPYEDGFSFPSGHVTAACAGVCALCAALGKKYALPGGIFVLLMAFSRCYLMAHYPSDTLAGIVAGALAAALSYGVTKLIYTQIEKHKDSGFSKFVLEFDIRRLFNH